MIEGYKMICPICGEEMKIREEEIDNDNFLSGKEIIIDGWDCECGISLDLYEN